MAELHVTECQDDAEARRKNSSSSISPCRSASSTDGHVLAGSSKARSCLSPADLLHGALFIDRDGTYFRYVLAYLRDGSSMDLPDDLFTCQCLLREAKFYQLNALEVLLDQHMSERRQQEQLAKHQERVESDMMKKLVEHSTAMRARLDAATDDVATMKTHLRELRVYLCPAQLYHRGNPLLAKHLTDELERFQR
eukprot:gene9440-9605_t